MYIPRTPQTAVDTLMMKFTTTIHDQAYAVVAEHVKVIDVVTCVSNTIYTVHMATFFERYCMYIVCIVHSQMCGEIAPDDHHLKAPYANLCKVVRSYHRYHTCNGHCMINTTHAMTIV